ncbi:hypothetical protein GBAR_LOCUS28990 [Geodia barretti]|uniref:Transmembrane protein n=1 Tax=Geodia barretti TaxID=519541 RepID=A0AA35TTW0_GEOBA|nr:hypothetical protein GBAR_LOCUS28990 [Geodia barretti]
MNQRVESAVTLFLLIIFINCSVIAEEDANPFISLPTRSANSLFLLLYPSCPIISCVSSLYQSPECLPSQ